MSSKLTTLRAHTLDVARKLETDARQYDKRGLQRMLSDGTVSSTNRNSLTGMINQARSDFAYNRRLANDVDSVARELTVYRHAKPQGEAVAQEYGSGPVRESSPQTYSSGAGGESSPQRYTEVIEVPPTPGAVAERVAMYAQQAARAKVALATLIEVKDAVVAQLAEQSLPVSVWEALKDSNTE